MLLPPLRFMRHIDKTNTVKPYLTPYLLNLFNIADPASHNVC